MRIDEQTPDVSIIIVNWNSKDFLRNCLRSIRSSERFDQLSTETIVVDNGSSDDSLARAELEPAEHLINNAINRGFGAACNQAADAAKGRYLLLLNPDCELRPGSLRRCVEEFAKESDQVGVCGIALEDERGSISRTCHRFPSFGNLISRATGVFRVFPRLGDGAMIDWRHDENATVDHVIGAFYLLPANLFRSVGGFDERFFVYLEDLDLSLRINRAGYIVRFVAEPRSFHAGGGASREIKATRLFYATRSRILYAFKHFPRWQAWLHAIVSLVLEPLSRSAQALLKGSPGGVAETWRGFGMLYRDLPKTMAVALRR